MARRKRFTGESVLDAARARIRHVFETFDSVVVMFSGGKDSQVVLHLVREAMPQYAGSLSMQSGRVQAVFRDEELIPDSVIEHVDCYRQRPWIDLRWLCVPLLNAKFILGRHFTWASWDPTREWAREPPSWAERGTELLEQQEMDGFIAAPHRGRVAIMLGLRAAESLMRYRAVVNRLGPENYISRSGSPRAFLVKPIYDWHENDVFKYLYEIGAPPCGLYEAQRCTPGCSLRVSTPMHAEAAKRLSTVRASAPDLYERVICLFPEMQAQERWWADFDRAKVIEAYAAEGWPGCERYIEEHFDPHAQELAAEQLDHFVRLAQAQPDLYNPAALLKHLSSGQAKRKNYEVST